MFRIIFPNTWYVDHHGTPCKILRSTHNKVHYIRKGRTCIASMFRFNHDFEPVNKADADRIAEEIESKRAARTVLTGMCYSVGSATRQGSSSPTRFIGQSAMTSRT